MSQVERGPLSATEPEAPVSGDEEDDLLPGVPMRKEEEDRGASTPPTRNVEEWVKKDAERYPQLDPDEILALRALFDEYTESTDEQITKEQVGHMLDQALRDLFDRIDKDKSKMLDRIEVARLIGDLGRPMNRTELDETMKELDMDGSGTVSFEEFKCWWEGDAQPAGGTPQTPDSPHSEREKELSRSEREKERSDELSDLFEAVDTDNSGRIDWDEFLRMIATQLDRAENTQRPAHSVQRGSDHDNVLSATHREPRDASTMVRAALESVRADVRAIYGTMSRPKAQLQLMSEAEASARARCCFFLPEGTGCRVRFRKGWDVVQVLMLAYVAIVVPLRIGFKLEAVFPAWDWFLEVIVDVYFWIDIVINFRTAYYVEGQSAYERVLVISQKQISRRYLRSWFLIDLVSCFPITYIELAVAAAANSENDGAGQNLKVLKVVRLLRLAKLLRLARVKRLIERLEEEYEGVAQVVGMSKIIAIILFIAHFIACLWYFVGSMGGSMTFGLDPNNPAQTEVVQGWVYQNGWRDDEAGGLESDFCSSEAGYKSCRVDYQTRYWDALYFSVTTLTTVGFGDRTPTTNSEKVYSIVAELAGCVIFGIIAGSLGRLATSTSISEVEKHHQKKQLEEFMKIKRVPSKVKHEVIEQMDHWFAKKSMFDENQLLAFLPPKHRKQLLLVIYKPYLTTCPLLAGMDDIVLTKLCVVMRPYLALKQDEIMTEDDVGEEMYMVVRGEIKLTSQTAPRYNKRSWHDGAFFGELTVLGAGAGPQRNRHIYSAEAVVESELTFITQQAIDRIETHNPTFKNKMRRMALQRAKRFGYQEYTEELEELHAKKVEERVDMIVDELDLCARAAAKAPTPGEVSLTESPYLNPMLEHVTRLQILTRQLKGHMQEFTASKRDTRNRMLGLEAASEAGVPTPPSTVHARSSRLRGYTQARVGPVLYGGGD